MDEKLIISYDKIGSFLFLELCPPYAEQDSDLLEDAVVVRYNPKTGALESVEILFFESWLKNEGEIRLPALAANFRLASAAPNGNPPATRPDAPLTIGYDHAADTLTLHTRPPHPGQRQASIGEGATAAMNDATGEIEHLAIRGFMARAARDGAVILPVSASFREVPNTAVVH